MLSLSAIPDSNPTRAQLRLVVLGQWVRAGLDLARRARTGGGVFGGAVALWQVFQAIRLAIQLARRLSDLQDALSRAARATAPRATRAQASATGSDDASGVAACLGQALSEIGGSIRDAVGPPRVRPGRSRAARPASRAAKPEIPRALGHPTSPRGRPPDRPPGFERWRRPCAAPA